MPPFDTAKLISILNAAQNPAFKKLLDDKTKAVSALAEAKAHLADLEAKLFSTIPPALKSLLQPDEPAKTRKPRASADNGNLKKPDLQELKVILDGLPNKTLNIRQEGYESRNIKILAEANPHLFAYEKGTWPRVKYLK
jgi:hypothetical protein